MTEKLRYRQLPKFSKEKIAEILEKLDYEPSQEILLLPLSIGQYSIDWKYAQDICLKLADHPSRAVRANACLGLAYIARNHHKLEKHLAKPILMRELRENDEFRWRIIDAIEDINIFMKWHLAHKPLNRP